MESWGKGQQKDQEEYKAIAQSHGILYKGLPHPKEKMLAWEPNAKQELTRAPMYGQALPFTLCHF